MDQGQALVEFLVVSAVLGLFLILIPLIGKYQDISHTTQMASRYAAFETAMRVGQAMGVTEADDLEHKVRKRFFAAPGQGIQSRRDHHEANESRHPLWTFPDGQSMLVGLHDIRTNIDSHNVSNSLVFPLHGQMGLRDTRTVSAMVSVPLAETPMNMKIGHKLSRQDLRMDRSMALLADAWTSSGTPETRNVIARTTSPQTQMVITMSQPHEGLRGILDHGVQSPQTGVLTRWENLVPADRHRTP